jgi:hypothetical protein
VCADALDARDRRDQRDGGAKGLQAFLHLRIDLGGGGRESIDLVSVKTKQKAVLIGTHLKRSYGALHRLSMQQRWCHILVAGPIGSF